MTGSPGRSVASPGPSLAVDFIRNLAGQFTTKSLAALCDPTVGLAIGCTVFAAKLRSAARAADEACFASNDVVQSALNLWNGGANAAYAAQVLTRVPHYQ